MLQSLSTLFSRDLKRVVKEIETYNSDANLWLTDVNISNSTGNLALHICGNLQHFIGATLGQTGYIRQREEEFSKKDVSRAAIITELEQTINVVSTTLAKLTTDDLAKTYPIDVFKKEMTSEAFLLHLSTHLNYHLGQINYHRRLLDK